MSADPPMHIIVIIAASLLYLFVFMSAPMEPGANAQRCPGNAPYSPSPLGTLPQC